MEENFIDHGDYIELIEPIGGIKMITKNPRNMSVEERSQINPRREKTGGFTDWRIPTLKNCETIRDYIQANGNILNFEDGWIKALSEKEMQSYAFNVFSGERQKADLFWPKDLCWVALVAE
ncbi:hypothetical protein J5690_10955 [bacterium]|nr:hypothetical protein [bacterium]